MAKISEILDSAVESFLEITPNITSHMENSENPHGVTKSQVGLGNVDNAKQASKTEFDSHTGNKANPHGVTKSQVGLGNVDNAKQASKTEFDSHTGNKANPHGVTKSQVGLGNVDNAKQASKTEFDSHVAGTASKHSASDIVYDSSSGKSVKDQILSMQLNAGQGTLLHNELQNRDTANQHSIDSITDLRDVLGYTIVMTGETTDGTTYVELLGDPALPQSKTGGFLDEDGRLTVPRGIVARAEVNIMCAQYAADTDGVNKINGNSLARFYLDTWAFALNSMRQIWYKDASGNNMEFTKFTRSTDTAATIDAKLAFKDVQSNKLTVRGAADTPMKWRAEIKISSILKV